MPPSCSTLPLQPRPVAPTVFDYDCLLRRQDEALMQTLAGPSRESDGLNEADLTAAAHQGR